MTMLMKTVLYDEHVRLNGKMIDFGGWEMPVNYEMGIIREHEATRNKSGLFDVSHMGRFRVSGSDALPFLQYSLTNNSAGLKPGRAQYTLIQNETGGAVDDAFLYRFDESEYILVVNASNRNKDMAHLRRLIGSFDVTVEDISNHEGMVALQGPDSDKILRNAGAKFPNDIKRNDLAEIKIEGVDIKMSRTGYTGEKIGCELFIPAASTPQIWRKLIELGATPAGLGARDTLRLEASMPLYGHELGVTETGFDIPIFAGPLSKFAVSFDDAKGNFYGKAALQMPVDKRIYPFKLNGKGIPRTGYKVLSGDEEGFVTSGTILPDKRAIGLALLGNSAKIGDEIMIEIRNKMVPAIITESNLTK